MRGTSKRSRIYYTKGRARGRESQFVPSKVSIVSTVEARDDGATVDALSMRRRVVQRKQSQASVFSSSRLSRLLAGDGPDSHD